MLAGEYAVLQGGTTLSTTISGALTVDVIGPHDKATKVSSSIWQEEITLDETARADDYSQEPLCQSILAGREFFNTNVASVRVSSNLDMRHGVGTSSALRLGVLLGMRAVSRQERVHSDWEIARWALDLQRKSQPDASGYDIATQLIGGLLHLEFGAIRQEPQWFSRSEKLGDKYVRGLHDKVHFFVGGHGAPTGPVMKNTLAWINQLDLHQEIFNCSERLVTAFEGALPCDRSADDRVLFEEMGKFRRIFASSPDFPRRIAEQISACKDCDKTWSFKTTGAGGEDALLLAGKKADLREAFAVLKLNGWYPMPYEYTNQGVTLTVREVS
jgi:mevalonate kinase